MENKLNINKMIEILSIFVFALVLGFFFVLTKNFYEPVEPVHQQVIGLTITFTSLILGLLIGFSFSNFWSRYIYISDSINIEEQQLMQMYEIIKDYPDTQGIINSIQDYIYSVINVEWPILVKGKFSIETDKKFKSIISEINKYVKLNPNSPITNQLYTLIPQRDRFKSIVSTNFGLYLIWIIILSAIVTLIGFWFLRNINYTIQIIIDIGIIIIISLSIYLLYELINPFSGIFSLSPNGFINLYDQIK
jgi:hypothetical protein